MDQLQDIRARIARSAEIAGRKPEAVELIAISKTHDAEAIEPLLAAGQRVFGENRVQEAEAKWPALRTAYPEVKLHLVGQLQSNKAEDAVALFDCIHSVDRPRWSRRWARRWKRRPARSRASSRSTSVRRTRRAVAPSPMSPRSSLRRGKRAFPSSA
ncbi:alanine racemase [Novosphingobium resinovorum]